MIFEASLRDTNTHCSDKWSSRFLQISKLVKTVNDTSSNKWERVPKHSGSQKLSEIVISRNVLD